MRYTITVEEVLKYDREFVVEIPDTMDEDSLDCILDVAQDKANKYEDFDSIYEHLQNSGVKVVEYADDSTDCPKDVEYEIYDMVKDGIESEDDDDMDDDDEF